MCSRNFNPVGSKCNNCESLTELIIHCMIVLQACLVYLAGLLLFFFIAPMRGPLLMFLIFVPHLEFCINIPVCECEFVSANNN